MARGVLPKFEITALKSRTSTDKTQVPAAATIEFYRQGATVASTVTVYPGTPPGVVPVQFRGSAEIGDVLRVGVTSTILTVVHVPSDTELHVNFEGPLPLVLAAGIRLWISSNRPSVYADPTGTASIGSAIGTAAATGLATAYLSTDRFDFEIVISGEATRYYLDQAAQWGRSDQLWIDIRDFGGSVSAALGALPESGGVVFVPRGVWLLGGGVVVDKPNVTILGEGASSVIKAGVVNAFDLVTALRSRLRLRNLALDGGASAYDANGKCCAVVSGSGAGSNDIHFESVRITGAPRHGLWVKNACGFSAEQCQFDDNWGCGARVEELVLETSTIGFSACTFNHNGLRGLAADRAHSLRLVGCTFDANRSGVLEFEGNALEISNSRATEVVSCSFRNPDTATRPTNFVALSQCLSPQLDGCCFDGGANEPQRPIQGVVFDASPGSRLSNCLGTRLTSYLARFASHSYDSVELCNVESETLTSGGITRLRDEAPRMVSMSRRALAIPILASEQDRPASPTPGTMAWVAGELHVWTVIGATGAWKRALLGA